jgi:hypothetical protein
MSGYKRMREAGSHSYAAMRIFRPVGIMEQQGNRTMMKNFALAASMTMLVAISGQAFAATDAPSARYWPEAAGHSDQRALNAFNAFDPWMATQTDETDAHRYHGGPKSND